jgi:predicted transcriptional regulator
MTKQGDFKCLVELLKPTRRVNDNDLQTLRVKEIGERVQLWTRIKKNQEKYENGECGEFDAETHQNIMASFIMAQLRLAATFSMNHEEVVGAGKLFTQAEIDAVTKLEKYNIFDIKSSEDVLNEIRRGDESTLICIRNYMREMEDSLEKVLQNPEIKRPVKLAIKETMKKRLQVFEAGVAEFNKRLSDEIARAKDQQAFDEKQQEIEAREEMVKEKENELEAQRERLRKIEQGMEEAGESRFVTRAEAKYMELNYIGRFDTKATTFPLTISSPIEGKEYRISSWSKHFRFSEREWMEKEFAGILPSAEIDREMPCSQRSVYSVTKKKHILSGKEERKVVVEAVAFNHLDAYAEVGYDRRPLSLEEFTGILSKSIDNAEMGNYFHVIGIASPTGISEKIREYHQSEDFHRRFISRYVSVCLVDPTTGEIIYNPADPNISRFVDLFKPEFDLEKVERLKNFIADKLSVADHIVLEDVAEETGDDRALVKKAFYDLEKEGYRLRYIDDVGFVLEAKRRRCQR